MLTVFLLILWFKSNVCWDKELTLLKSLKTFHLSLIILCLNSNSIKAGNMWEGRRRRKDEELPISPDDGSQHFSGVENKVILIIVSV